MRSGVEGLQCWECTNPADKCTLAQDGKGDDDDHHDDTWYGKKVNCTDEEDHCMISRTGKLITQSLYFIGNGIFIHNYTCCKSTLYITI